MLYCYCCTNSVFLSEMNKYVYFIFKRYSSKTKCYLIWFKKHEKSWFLALITCSVLAQFISSETSPYVGLVRPLWIAVIVNLSMLE